MTIPSRRLTRLRQLALATLSSTIGLTASAGIPDAPTSSSAAIAHYLAQCHAVRICNGSFRVSEHGRLIYTTALGDADAGGKEQLTVDHQFDIGSVSKQFTAAAIVRLAEQGKLNLDDPAAKYLPELPYSEITLRHLLTHTSGVPDLFPVYREILKNGKTSAPMQGNEAVALLVAHKAPLSFVPGSAFDYSNTGYILLAQVVARVSGIDFAQFMQREFFGPLQMAHTHVRVPGNETYIQPRAYGFVVRSDGTRKALDQIPGFYPVGPGGIYSTTSDLQRWADALDQGKVMSKSSWTLASAPTRLTDGSTVPYGFGFKLQRSALGRPMVAHGGDWRGFKADFTLLPEQGVQILMLTNNGQDDSVEAARDAIEAILAGKPHVELRESVHWELFRRANDANATELKAWLLKEWEKRPQRYDFPGQPLEQVASELLRSKESDKGLAVLEFNAQVHPGSLDALDSLANAYLETGNRQAAVEQMEKMLKIKPDSRRIRERLKQIQK